MEKKYDYEEVKAFALIALSNLLHSANKNDISLKTFELFLDPLEKVYEKLDVIESANKLRE